MPSRRPLPNSIDRPMLLATFASLDAGSSHAFAESTGYDVLHEGRRYPPKAIVGLAAEHVTGEPWKPSDFSGGVDSACFRLLKRHGFDISPKQRPEDDRHELPSEPGTRWSSKELRAATSAYAEMAIAEAAGEPVHEASVRRALRAGTLSGRTEASIEFRMRNVTSVAREIGAPEVSGYLPAGNVGAQVSAVIHAALMEAIPSLSDPTDDPEVLAGRVRAVGAALGTDPPAGARDPEKRLTSSTVYARDPKVVAWVLKTAAGVCEACGENAPFQDSYGIPFLEVHHVWPLGDGGPDTTDNAAAVCPNCHRALHLAADRDPREAQLRARVPRLVDERPD